MTITNTMGHEMLTSLVLLFTVILWKHVMSQCSEAHSVACSLPLMQLEKYDAMMYPISGYMPDYNQSTLSDICGLFQEYMNCSRPFLQNCDSKIVNQLNVLESAFIPICQDYTNEYILHRSCFKSHETSYSNCQNKRREQLQVIAPSNNEIEYKTQTCNVTNQYLKCVYIVTSLGCSLEAANVYFNILNQTISILMRNSSFICNIRHPKDTIEVFTTTSSTTRETSTSISTSSKPPVVGTTLKGPTSNANHISLCVPVILFSFIFIVFRTLVFDLNTHLCTGS